MMKLLATVVAAVLSIVPVSELESEPDVAVVRAQRDLLIDRPRFIAVELARGS